jgi:hypothetical protein
MRFAKVLYDLKGSLLAELVFPVHVVHSICLLTFATTLSLLLLRVHNFLSLSFRRGF